MFCEKCGRKLEDTTSFCPYCGYKVTILQRNADFSGSSSDIPLVQKGFVYTGTDAGTFAQEGVNGVSMNTTPGYVEPAAENKHGLVRTDSAEKKKGILVAVVIAVVIFVIAAAFGAFWLITDGELFKSDKLSSNKETELTEPLTTVAASDTGEIFTPDTTVADISCYVNVGTAILYKGPDTSAYKAVVNVSKDDVLVVKGSHKAYPGWLYVYSAKTNDYGWISEALLSENKSTDTATTDVNTNTEVIYYDSASRFDVMINVGEGHNLNLRRQPDTTDPDNVIMLLPDKARVLVLGVSSINNKWYYVEYTDELGSYYGYIHSDHTQRFY